MNNERSVLGRGLSSLIPNAGQSGSWGPVIQTAPGEQIVRIPVESVDANPHQPRSYFDQEKLEELARSIKEYGIIQPLVVTESSGGRYQLVAGERRLKAAKLINMSDVPVVIRKLEEQKKLEISLIENLQRHDLNPLEEALSYRRLMDEFGLTQEEVAERVSKSRSSVANFLRLLTLPKQALEALGHTKITFSHAKVILSYATEKEQLRALNKILKEHLTVAAASQPVKKSHSQGTVADPVLASWEEKVTAHLGFRTRIKKTVHGGHIEISFQSEEDLKSLLDKLLQ